MTLTCAEYMDDIDLIMEHQDGIWIYISPDADVEIQDIAKNGYDAIHNSLVINIFIQRDSKNKTDEAD